MAQMLTGADLQAFLIFCFKPILFSSHKLILLIYGDNRAVVVGEGTLVLISKTTATAAALVIVSATA